MGSLILISPKQAYTLAVRPTNKASPRLQPTEIDEWKIKDKARLITVRVFSQDNTASGILIDQQNTKVGEQSIYLNLVVTNNHVVSNPKAEYHIETSDGRVYKAFFHPKSKFGDDIDLVLLYFYSPIRYEKAVIGDLSQIKNEEIVFVGGFACQGRFCEKEPEFLFKSGQALLLNKPLVKGYQLGFTSETKPGTSGGVVLNKKGELVAINGRGKFPLGNGQYEYADGTMPSREQQDYMRYFAWGIPVNAYKNLVPKAPFAEIPPSVEPTKQTNYVPDQTLNQKSIDFFSIKNLLWACFIILAVGFVGYLIWIIWKNSKDSIQKLFLNDFLKIKEAQNKLDADLKNLQEKSQHEYTIIEKFRQKKLEIVKANLEVEFYQYHLRIKAFNKKKSEIEQLHHQIHIQLKHLQAEFSQNIKIEEFEHSKPANEKLQINYRIQLKNIQKEFYLNPTQIKEFEYNIYQIEQLQIKYRTQLENIHKNFHQNPTQIEEFEQSIDVVKEIQKYINTQLQSLEAEFSSNHNTRQ